ncbi:MAG: helix-turn-helix domain-containing protein [Lautropia sp.]
MLDVVLKTDAEPQTIGRRLREERRRRGASLQQIATAAGISTSWLSRLESARARAPYDTLKRICDALEIGLEEAIHPEPRAFSSGRCAITRRGEPVRFQSDEYDYAAHAGDLLRKSMIPLEMTVRARTVEQFDHWSRHAGEEFVYVISGAITVHTEEYAPFRLDAGESAYFDSAMGHCYVNALPEDARILSIAYDPQSGRSRLDRFMNPSTRQVSPETLLPERRTGGKA